MEHNVDLKVEPEAPKVEPFSPGGHLWDELVSLSSGSRSGLRQYEEQPEAQKGFCQVAPVDLPSAPGGRHHIEMNFVGTK